MNTLTFKYSIILLTWLAISSCEKKNDKTEPTNFLNDTTIVGTDTTNIGNEYADLTADFTVKYYGGIPGTGGHYFREPVSLEFETSNQHPQNYSSQPSFSWYIVVNHSSFNPEDLIYDYSNKFSDFFTFQGTPFTYIDSVSLASQPIYDTTYIYIKLKIELPNGQIVSKYKKIVLPALRAFGYIDFEGVRYMITDDLINEDGSTNVDFTNFSTGINIRIPSIFHITNGKIGDPTGLFSTIGIAIETDWPSTVLTPQEIYAGGFYDNEEGIEYRNIKGTSSAVWNKVGIDHDHIQTSFSVTYEAEPFNNQNYSDPFPKKEITIVLNNIPRFFN